MNIDYFALPDEHCEMVARFAKSHGCWVAVEPRLKPARILDDPETELKPCLSEVRLFLKCFIGHDLISPPWYRGSDHKPQLVPPLSERASIAPVASQCVNVIIEVRDKDDNLPCSGAGIARKGWFVNDGVAFEPVLQLYKLFRKELVRAFDKNRVVEFCDYDDPKIVRGRLPIMPKALEWAEQGNPLSCSIYPMRLGCLADKPKKAIARKPR